MFSLWRKARRENSAASRLLGSTSLRFALHGWQRKQLPPIPLRQNGKRGRVTKSDAHNLWERLKKHEMAVLLFARLSTCRLPTNRAERDLRMSKVKQKVSGCFRTRKHAEAYCRISSYLQTMANQGYNPLVAIQMAFSGQLYADRGE